MLKKLYYSWVEILIPVFLSLALFVTGVSLRLLIVTGALGVAVVIALVSCRTKQEFKHTAFAFLKWFVLAALLLPVVHYALLFIQSSA